MKPRTPPRKKARPDTTQRSTFVTVIAWIFIGLSGLGGLITAFDGVLTQIIMQNPQLKHAMTTLPAGMPRISVFFMHHLLLVASIELVFMLVTLVSAIGLLRRWNWARRCFIGLLAIGIVWNLTSIYLQRGTAAMMHQQMAQMHAPAFMASFTHVIIIASAIFALAVCVTLGWIIKRLMAARVVAEFAA